MSQQLANTLVIGAWSYLGVGLVFALVFIAIGARVVDPKTQGSSPLFRVLIIPGCAALWPLLLQKWWQARVDRHTPKNTFDAENATDGDA